jgi:outer membrane biosynthesis protein TonB
LSRLDFVGHSSALLAVLALAAAASLGLSACGEGGADLLPGGTASEINANLDQVERLASEGDCVGAADAAQAVSAQIDALGGVDAKLKQALREGATRLNEVVASCEEATVEEETVPTIEEAEEPEAEEKPAKPEKAKPSEEAPEAETAPSLPPQAEGKAKGHEKQEEEVPPAETGEEGTPSGGLGPGEPAQGNSGSGD